MEDRERDEDEGTLPPGDPTQLDPPNTPDASPEPPELAQGDETAPGPIEFHNPPGDVEASPGQDVAADLHRRFSEFGKAYLDEIDRQRMGTSADADSIPWPEARLPERQAPTEHQQPKREIRDFLHRPEDEAAGRFEKLPGIRPIHGAAPPKIQLMSDADGENTSPTDSVEPPSTTAPDVVIEAPSNPEHAPDVPPQAYVAPPASRNVRLPFPGESRDDIPDTLEGLVELHERQTAGPASSPGAPSPPSSPPDEQPPANVHQSPADEAPSTSSDDAGLHALPQVLVTVSLIDAERMVSEEFRSMADQHAEAMREIASEELDEYNFKIMAELRAVFGR